MGIFSGHWVLKVATYQYPATFQHESSIQPRFLDGSHPWSWSRLQPRLWLWEWQWSPSWKRWHSPVSIFWLIFMWRPGIWLLCRCSERMSGVPHLPPDWGQRGTSDWDRKMEFLLRKCDRVWSANFDLQLPRECIPMRGVSKFVRIRRIWKSSRRLLDEIRIYWHQFRVSTVTAIKIVHPYSSCLKNYQIQWWKIFRT